MNEIGLRECHAFEAAGQQFLYLVLIYLFVDYQ